MQEAAANAVDFAQSDITEAVTIDRLAGNTIESDTLKLIYSTILNLAYALFLIGIMFSLATDSDTRDKFVDYLKRTLSVVFVVVMVILGVLTYSLSKAYASDKKYSPKTKRTINFV